MGLKGDQAAWLKNTYYPALVRGQPRCFKPGKHKCDDSMLLSRFQEFIDLVSKFPFALYFQEAMFGMAHWGHTGITHDDECEHIPHHQWHLKANEFLAGLAQQTLTLRDDVQDYDKCKDLKRNSGNMFGAGSMIDIIGSDHVQKAVASLVQLMGPKMKKTGVEMVDNMIANFAKKKAGSADPLPVLEAVDRIKHAITKGGKCSATYGPHHQDREVANVVCDCSKTVKPTTTAPPPAAPVAPVVPVAPAAPAAPVTPVGGNVAKKPAGQAAGAGSGSGTATAVTATTATTATAVATEQHSVLVPDLPFTKPAMPPLVRPTKTVAAAKKVAAQKAEAKKGAAVATKTVEEATVAANVDDPDTEVERAVLSERKWRAGGGGVDATTAEERDDDPEGGDQTTGEKVIGVLPSIAASEMVDNGTGLDSVGEEAPGTKEGAKGTGVGVGETGEGWEG